jgi:hypothetical protein
MVGGGATGSEAVRLAGEQCLDLQVDAAMCFGLSNGVYDE